MNKISESEDECEMLNKETRMAECVVYCEICKYWNMRGNSDKSPYKWGDCLLMIGGRTYDDDYCSKGCLKAK